MRVNLTDIFYCFYKNITGTLTVFTNMSRESFLQQYIVTIQVIRKNHIIAK